MTSDSSFDRFLGRLHSLIASSGAPPAPHPLENEELFNSLALDLFRFQLQLNTPYARWSAARGLGSIQDWRQIPAFPTDGFKGAEATCLPPELRVAEFRSSGTTGRDTSRHLHSRTSLALYEASAIAGFRAHFQPPDARRVQLISLIPQRQHAPQSSLAHMIHLVANEPHCQGVSWVGTVDADGAWQVDAVRFAAAVRAAHAEGRVAWVMGTAFNFVHLLEALEGSGSFAALPAGSLVMETGGYKGRSRTVPREELHAWISRGLGCPTPSIITEYGMCELSSQAYSVAASGTGRALRFPPWARIRVVSPEDGADLAPGQTGLLEIVDLANAGSVICIRTSDLAVRTAEGFELLGRATAAERRGCSLMSSDIQGLHVH